MLTMHELLKMVKHLPAADKWQLVKYVLDTLERANPAVTADYHQFLCKDCSVLRDTSIERWEQGEYEERELLE